MLRCPFNNFSKCDGSCPFSMPDFAGCKLAVLLAQVEGQSRGHLAQLNNVNANLEDVRNKLEELGAKLGALGATQVDAPQAPVRKERVNASMPEKSYLLRYRNKSAGRDDIRLSLDPETTDAVTAEFGTRVDVIIVAAPPQILVVPGTGLAVTRNHESLASVCRGAISLNGKRRVIDDTFGTSHYTYLDAKLTDGILRLTPTGEVE